MKKIIYLYLCTAIVCFTFASVYTYLEETHTDEIFDARPMFEKQFYVKYCSDELSFNPYDSYTSKLEHYVLMICWIIGCWNLMDVFLLIGIKNDLRGKPEDHLLYSITSSESYRNITKKLRKIRKIRKKGKNNMGNL